MKVAHILGAVFGVLFLVVFLNIHDMYAYFWQAENTIVTLSGCEKDCEIKGTLSIEPWTGNHKLVSEDGSETTLPQGSFVSIEYPVTDRN